MVSALMNSEKPRPALQRRNGARRTRHYPITRGTGPVAVTVQGGVARPGLYAVGTPRPAIEVPSRIDVEALADALNAQLSGTPITDEVTAFYALLAGAFGQGMEHAEQMAGAS